MKYKISVFAGMVVCMGIGILIGRLSTPPALISHPDAPVMGGQCIYWRRFSGWFGNCQF